MPYSVVSFHAQDLIYPCDGVLHQFQVFLACHPIMLMGPYEPVHSRSTVWCLRKLGNSTLCDASSMIQRAWYSQEDAVFQYPSMLRL